MNDIVFKSDDLMVMNLLNYFITEAGYNPMIIHGVNNEIWLENMENDYKIIRIVSHHIHNKEQYDFDKFKLNRIVKEVKKKTFSFKIKVLNIYTDIENEKLLSDDDILLDNDNDIPKSKLVHYFPNIIEKTKRNEDGIDYVIKVTDNINKTNERKNEMAKKIFSNKKPIITYAIIGICFIIFLFMYIFGNGSNDISTLIKFGANSDILVKNGEYFRLFTHMFLHIGIIHILLNMSALYYVGSEIENLYGKWKFVLIYIFSGICGGLFEIIFAHNVVSAGASGAIFGLFGSLLYFGYYYRPYLGSGVIRNILPIIVLNLILGFVTPNIGNSSHIGGLIGGLLISMAVGVPGKNKKADHVNGIVLSILYLLFIVYLAFYM